MDIGAKYLAPPATCKTLGWADEGENQISVWLINPPKQKNRPSRGDEEIQKILEEFYPPEGDCLYPSLDGMARGGKFLSPELVSDKDLSYLTG